MRERKRRPKLRVIAGSGVEADTVRSGGLVAAKLPARGVSPAEDAGAVPPLVAPQPSASDDELRHYYEHQHDRRRIADNVDRLRHAIVDLAAIELAPARLLPELSPTFDRPVIRERLVRAIDCLSHFAEAWCLDEAGKAPRPPRAPGKSGKT